MRLKLRVITQQAIYAIRIHRHMQNFIIRATLLLILFVATNLWLVRHMGYGLGDPRLLGGVGAALIVAFGLVSKLFDEIQKKYVETLSNKLKQFTLSTSVIWLLYLGASFIALTYSSVLIIPEQSGQLVHYEINPVENASLSTAGKGKGESVYRVGLWTGPFGRTYQLNIDGYSPVTFDVFPLTGKVINLSKDVEKSPTLLLRPWIKGRRSLANNGTFKLWRILSEERQLVTSIQNFDGSFLVGWPQALPREFISDWRSELVATGGSNVTEDLIERTIRAWRKPQHIYPEFEDKKVYFKPGEHLQAEIYTRVNELAATVSFVVANQSLQDVVIDDI